MALPVIFWAVAVIAIVGGIVVYFLLDTLSGARFMNAGKVPDSIEGAQFRLAIDRLEALSRLPGATQTLAKPTTFCRRIRGIVLTHVAAHSCS